MWKYIITGVSAAASLAWAADCSRTSTGFTPLNDPFFVRTYQRQAGGLYPNGANQRPPAHETLGLKLMADVKPRDASGAPDAGGRIVLLSIGMSNATQEFSAFKPLADRDPEKNPQLVIVDGAQGGWSADRIVSDPDTYWQTVDQRLRMAGVTPAQVQAAWMKDADPGPTLGFPGEARRLQSALQAMAQMARARFPNLRLMYLSSRTYAGYATTNLNPEPYAYESGFSVKWLIEAQINGSPDLSIDAGKAPWLAWGPYLWTDGMNGRADGLIWTCSDTAEDGTHPSESGRRKVAELLLNFFKSDTTTRPWFVRASGPPATTTPKPAALVNAATYAPEVANGSIASIFGTDLAGASIAARTIPLPVSLGGTRVEIGGEPAGLYAVTPAQINFVLPRETPASTAVVIRDGIASDSVPIRFALFAPGIFTLDGKPDGPAAALDARGHVISPENPVRRGGIVQLFFTGMGFRNPLSLRPDVLPIVRVGDSAARILFAGIAPGIPGMNQVNFVVPDDAPVGSAIAVQVLMAGAGANRATLAVSE